MEKDLESYNRHEHTYQSVSANWIREKQDEMERLGNFKLYGFKQAMDKNPLVRSVHIDIGSGAGWLLKYTAPHFKRVIAIEPSVTATDFAKAYNHEFTNIESQPCAFCRVSSKQAITRLLELVK